MEPEHQWFHSKYKQKLHVILIIKDDQHKLITSGFWILMYLKLSFWYKQILFVLTILNCNTCHCSSAFVCGILSFISIPHDYYILIKSSTICIFRPKNNILHKDHNFQHQKNKKCFWYSSKHELPKPFHKIYLFLFI